MKDKAMSWLMLVVMVLLCSIIFVGAMLIHNAASAGERLNEDQADSRWTLTDRDGHFAGSSITHGPKTDFYDARGRYQGTAIQQSGDQSHPLGNVHGSDPFGRRGR